MLDTCLPAWFRLCRNEERECAAGSSSTGQEPPDIFLASEKQTQHLVGTLAYIGSSVSSGTVSGLSELIHISDLVLLGHFARAAAKIDSNLETRTKHSNEEKTTL
ncbi:unnamed protein product [Brassica rapa]|uniref:Uncharacterized protein n=1 Tax=Brassica campestris TaxID=3711 RepID=A0A8D9HFU2_BRACM|nr:unnamed protein product [Brassica rapa]